MKVLFVSSGNSKLGISPIIKAQGESLRCAGVDLDYYTIVGKGYKGYLQNVLLLKRYLKDNHFNLVHSHFFLSSIVATLANPKKQVVSLMGSDVYTSPLWNFLIRFFLKRWNAVIVKSERMNQQLKIDAEVIPNGVDTSTFYPVEKMTARKELGWDKNKKYVLFASSPDRPEKNYELANAAVTNIEVEDKVEIVTLKDVQHEKIAVYLNAADLLLMTSRYEGSPNIIKEAMACNCPIVSTDVGDVRWVIGNTEGCYLISEKSNEKREMDNTNRIKETSDRIQEALHFAEFIGRTKGGERIIELGLDSETVAKKIITIYKRVLAKY